MTNPKPSLQRASIISRARLLASLSLFGALIPTLLNAAPGDVKWKFEQEDVFGSLPCAGPDGTVYFLTFTRGILFAVDGATGLKKWEHETGAMFNGSHPVVAADGTVYAGLGDGRLVAVDGATGERLWSFKSANPVFSRMTGATIAPDGTLYALAVSDDLLPDVTFLQAVNGVTGESAWDQPFRCPVGRGGCSGCAFVPPAAGADGTVYFAAQDKKLRALDRITGTVKWEFETEGQDFRNPVVGSDGTVYFGGGGRLVTALEGATGKEKWHANGMAGSSLTIGSDGTLYISAWDPETKLFALDGSTGTRKWEFVPEVLGSRVSAAVIGSDGTLYCTGWQRLYALDAATGQMKWTVAVGAGATDPVLGPDGSVYFCVERDGLYAVETSSVGGLADSPWPSVYGNSRNSSQGGDFAPRLLRAPRSTVWPENQPARLSAYINANPLPEYQWFHNGQPVVGATNSAYSVTSVSGTNEGQYTLIASNRLGTAAAGPAALFVNNVTTSPFVALFIHGQVGSTVRLESAEDLQPPVSWTALAAATLDASPTPYLDLSAVNVPHRFYRSPGATRLGLFSLPGWTLTGAIGDQFRIDFVDAPLTAADWTPLTTLTLTNTHHLFIDLTATNAVRFYRSTRRRKRA